MHFLILLVVQAAMPGAIAEEERKSSALEMLQASDIRLPVEVDLGSTYEEINALSEKFKELESKFEASETKISGLKSEIAQMEEDSATSETKINELKSKIANMEEASSSASESNNEISGLKSKISGLESKIAHVEKNLPKCQWGKTDNKKDKIFSGFKPKANKGNRITKTFGVEVTKTFKFKRPFTKIPSVILSVVGSWTDLSDVKDVSDLSDQWSSGYEDFFVRIQKVTPTEVTVTAQGQDENQEIDIEYMACVNLNL